MPYVCLQVRKIEAKVVEPLTLYGTACKHAKVRPDWKNNYIQISQLIDC